MQIIPVLDLKNGQVVRAEGGRRDSYLPIATPLSASADPVAVARGLSSLHAFKTFYLADIDAIEGRKPNHHAVDRLSASVGEIWIDAGLSDEDSILSMLEHGNVHTVIGSENQSSAALVRRFRDDPRAILSLDFFADGYRGVEGLLDQPNLWPARVIVMTLARVGSGTGPDFVRLEEIKRRAGDRFVYAAGGVRNEADLNRLAEMGIAGALVASALHDGSLTPDVLGHFE